jgi:hypothetical protein
MALWCLAANVVLDWGLRGIDLLLVDAPRAAPRLAVVYGGVTTVTSIARAVGTIAFLVWIYRAAQRAHDQGRAGLTISPGWCVGWFFVPVAQLFMPFRAMSGLAIASDPRERGHAPGYVLAWWLMYLGSLIVFFVGARSYAHHGDIGADLGATVLANVLSTGAVLALWATMRFIERGQAYWATQARGASESSTKRRKRKRRGPAKMPKEDPTRSSSV